MTDLTIQAVLFTLAVVALTVGVCAYAVWLEKHGG